MNLSYRLPSTIRGRLYVLLLITIVPILLIEFVYCYSRFQTRREREYYANMEVASLVREAFDKFVDDIVHQELAIGINLTFPQPPSIEQMNQILRRHKEVYPAIRNFSWVDPQGYVIASSMDSNMGINVSDRAYIQAILSGKGWVLDNLVLSRATGEPLVPISCGIHDEQGNLLGIVIAAVFPERLSEVLRIERARGGAITLIDAEGKAVFRYPPVEWTWEQRSVLKDNPTVKRALQGESVTDTISGFFDGEKRMVALVPSRSTQWVVGASRSAREAMQPVIYELLMHAGLFSLLTLGIFITAMVLAKSTADPIVKLYDHTLALGRGDLDRRVEISGPTELRELGLAFNTMAEAIAAREKALRKSENESRHLAERLLSAHEEERKRIAGELHDSIGGSLGVVRFSLENTLTQAREGTVEPQSIANLIATVGDAIEEVRRITMNLRPSMLDHLGLVPTINWLCRQFESSMPDTHIDKHIGVEEEQIPEHLKVIIFRIAQEAFHNASKYSKADLVTISLVNRNGLVELVVTDNGVGFDVPSAQGTRGDSGGLGLTSMRERVQFSGGVFSIESAIGEGTTIRARWGDVQKLA